MSCVCRLQGGLECPFSESSIIIFSESILALLSRTWTFHIATDPSKEPVPIWLPSFIKQAHFNGVSDFHMATWSIEKLLLAPRNNSHTATDASLAIVHTYAHKRSWIRYYCDKKITSFVWGTAIISWILSECALVGWIIWRV